MSLKSLGTLSLSSVTKSGVKLALTLDRGGKTTATVVVSASDARKLHLTTSKSTKPFVLGTIVKTFKAAGKSTATLKIAKSKLGHLRHHTVHATVQVVVTGAAGATTTKTYKLTIKG